MTKIGELTADLARREKANSEALEAWRNYDRSVAEIKVLEASRIARWGGICLGLYLGGVIGLFTARGFPAERAIVEASDWSATFAIWLLMAPMLIAPVHCFWKLFATKRQERLVAAVTPPTTGHPVRG
jgi:hypothetical protein